jgi:hypothetical protein
VIQLTYRALSLANNPPISIEATPAAERIESNRANRRFGWREVTVYGMVNRALEDMIIERFGPSAWEKVKEESDVDVEVFVSNSGYPDEMTNKLVEAASRILEMPADEILRAFGRYWVLQTARDGYGELLNGGGRDLPEFLRNLPTFHARVSLIFPHLRPPRFSCFDVTESSLCLRYYSDRPGLAPFVIGLLNGLGEMFHTPVRVCQEGSKYAGLDHDTFQVEWDRQIS